MTELDPRITIAQPSEDCEIAFCGSNRRSLDPNPIREISGRQKGAQR